MNYNRKKPTRAQKRDLRDLELKQIEELNLKANNINASPANLFSELPISKKTAEGLSLAKFVETTEIQKKALPLALARKDVMGAAKTGSGKTLAFLIPILEILYREKWTSLDGLGALIISPTRELAVQTFEVLCKIGKKHTFSAGLVIGGKNLKEERERISRMNILVSTPGRLLQHMDQEREFDLSNLQVLVLDEADRIMDMGFEKTVNAIIENIPKTRQTLLFSATQTKSVKSLVRLSLKDPEYVSVHESDAHATPQKLNQYFMVVDLPKKLDMLFSFIKTHLKTRTLVFLSSCKQVRFVYETFCKLQPGIPLLHLHGKQKQMARVHVFERFMRMQYGLMFCTDIAARGLDFPAVDWVIQLDCPEDVDTYIHRVGRAARYESSGNALLFLLPSELAMIDEMEERKIPITKINPKQNKTVSISSQLQHFCFQETEIKYLGQKSFISYVRSVYLQKNKNVFKVQELPIHEYAESLGLPGAPKIKFLQFGNKKPDLKKMNTSEQPKHQVFDKTKNESSGSENENSDSEEPVNNTKSGKDVVTKVSKMVNRKNMGVLADHYLKIVDRTEDDFGPGEGDSDGEDFLIPKEKSSLKQDLEENSDSDHDNNNDSFVKVLITNPDTNLPIEGNAKPIYEMADEKGFYKEGDVKSLVNKYASAALDKMRSADLDDKMVAKEKRKQKRAQKKQRSKENAAENGPQTTAVLGPQFEQNNTDGDSSEDEIYEEFSSENEQFGQSDSENEYSSGDESEEKSSTKSAPRSKKRFEYDSDDVSSLKTKKQRVSSINASSNSLEDQEQLALKLLENKADIEPLSDAQLNEIIVMLPIAFPAAMIPARLPELHYKMKNKMYPEYLHYALVALGSAASKGIRSPEEKEQDLIYIRISINLLKLKTDIRDPYYLWTCVIILYYFSIVVNTSLYESALILAQLSVKISRIYQLDLSKITKLKYSEEELEFRRRVFWSFYAFDRGGMSFSGSLPTIQDLDIVVNLPENDFWWRYGGECKVEHVEIIFWNHIANSENSEQFSKGDIKNIVKTQTLSGKVSIFAKRRWLKKVYNPDDDNLELVLLIDKLDKYYKNVVSNPPINFDLIKEAYSKYKDTIRFTMDIEHALYKYTFNQFHLYMKNVLYQTEMVRVEGIHMHPGRIVSAKNVLVDTAKKQIDLIYNLNNALPPEYWKTKTVSTGLLSAITCFNLMNTSPKNNLDMSKKMEKLKEVYHKLSSYTEIPVIFLMYLNHLSTFINESHKENEKSKTLFENMKKYSINESDVHPWLVPKYGPLFFVTCCFQGTFSSMKITDYLYIKDTFATFVNKHQKPESSNDSNTKPIGNSNTFGRKSQVHPGVPISSKGGNSESSYKANYDQYIKFSKLLEESSPNASQNYFYQYMVDILSDAIVRDIISNPVNNQTNFEPQFIFPTININSSHTRTDGKKNENDTQYDLTELDEIFRA
ncbi:hypothetical protein BB559_005423 [Furculomyces boomerangus]|uniref:ATP-dependent RNA helicase n=1 Tax=Furculomyces boomerangus TaxID=61424 RepID=A0A2T9Y8S3_9FUNG|nr:hypothetical protein BB559_005423 [Furculomyces boomerangus]